MVGNQLGQLEGGTKTSGISSLGVIAATVQALGMDKS